MAPEHSCASPGLLWRMRDGTRITLRPLQAQDQPLLDAMLERLSPQARRNRFLGGVNSRSAMVETLNAEGGVAFVMLAENQHRTQVVAEARYAVDAGGESAEFALVVDERWQRCGLGERAIRALGNTAAHAGLLRLYGEVSADNRPMLALMQRCHFRCTPDQEDPRLVHVEISLRSHNAPPERVHWWQPRAAHRLFAGYA